jgi:Tol biopolymer transport system component
MKRCPECLKSYYDESLVYCLDDGSQLVNGSPANEPPTAIISGDFISGESQTRHLRADGSATYFGRVRGIASRERLGWIVACALLLALAASAPFVVRNLRHPHQIEPMKSVFQLQPGGRSTGFGQVSISPDGRSIAVVTSIDGTNMLWIRSIDSAEGRALPGTDWTVGNPFWSPDGRSIVFQAAGKLKRVDLADGAIRELADLQPDLRGFDGTWNRDGTILYFDGGSGIMRMNAAGGGSKSLAGYEPRSDGLDRWPRFLPDGKHFIFLATSSGQGKSELCLGSIDSAERKSLFPSDSNAFYSPTPDGQTGYLLFGSRGSLIAQGFDPNTNSLVGEAFRVAQTVRINSNSRAFFSVSENGTLIYDPSSDAEQARHLTWYDRTGKAVGADEQAGQILGFALAPDERSISMTRLTAGAMVDEISVTDTARGSNSRLALVTGEIPSTAWSPNGKNVVWNDTNQSKSRLITKLASGAGEAEVLLDSAISLYPTDWSPDGRFILYTMTDPVTTRDIWVLPLFGDRKPFAYLQTPYNERDGKFSPDGKFVAYTSEENGGDDIYVQSFPASTEKWTISTHGGSSPHWSRDGRELFYMQNDGKVMAVAIKTAPSFEAGVPQALFDVTAARSAREDDFAVSNDGQRLLFISRGSSEGVLPPLVVVLNWSLGAGK